MKIIEVNDCRDCPYVSYEEYHFNTKQICKKTGLWTLLIKTTDYMFLLEKCPLPDKEK